MKEKKALIFTGGKGPLFDQVEEHISTADLIAAADSGWDLAGGMGITPDVFIGDRDSLSDHHGVEQLERKNRLIYPADKDLTDTELALNYLDELNYRNIVLIGGGGGRIDHLLAIFFIFSREIHPSQWYTSDEHLIYIDKDEVISCYEGQTVSIFPCGIGGCVLSSAGLKWEMADYVMDQSVFSISNTALKDRFSLGIKSGAALVILNY
jgi:thiamine pyrophosphokinase